MLYEILDLPLSILVVVAIILFFVGFFSPEKSLFWYKKKQTRTSSAIIYFSLIIVISLIHGGIKPQKLIDEEKQAKIKEEKEKLIQQQKKQEEEERNAVYRIDNCNNFKDNTLEYKGHNVRDVFYSENQYQLRGLIEKFKKYSKTKFVPGEFYHQDEKGNVCHVVVDIPISMEIPNITSHGEKVELEFTSSEGKLNKGNTLVSITRVD